MQWPSVDYHAVPIGYGVNPKMASRFGLFGRLGAISLVIALAGCAVRQSEVVDLSDGSPTIASGIIRIVSPDGATTVKVTNRGSESGISFLRSGQVLVSMNGTSDDGEHGWYVSNAEWTPNSDFFAFAVENSGGHQSWHTPLMVFSRRRGAVFDLDRALIDPVTEPNFSFRPNDEVVVTTTRLPLGGFAPSHVTISLMAVESLMPD